MGISDKIEVAMTTILEIEAMIYKLSWSDRKYQMREMLPKISDTKTMILFKKNQRFVKNMWRNWSLQVPIERLYNDKTAF